MTIISLSCTEPDCSWAGKNQLELKGHHVRVHQIQQYRCLVCGRGKRSYKKISLLKVHLERRHPVGGFRCYLCAQWYRQHDHLIRHYALQHQPGLYRCPHGDCGQLFTTKQAENAHRRFCGQADHATGRRQQQQQRRKMSELDLEEEEEQEEEVEKEEKTKRNFQQKVEEEEDELLELHTCETKANCFQ
ncbi:hypothetical protein TYRP_012680 [Tyrophagus putrescentiae]|nr:hypothetical protein TYRP_012680 [Tyrophagus putrescentiae]